MPRAKIAMKDSSLESNTPERSVPSTNLKAVVMQPKRPVKYTIVEPQFIKKPQPNATLTEYTLPIIGLFITAGFTLTVMLGSHAQHAIVAQVTTTENVASLAMVSKPQAQAVAAVAPVAPAAPAVAPKQELFSILNKE